MFRLSFAFLQNLAVSPGLMPWPSLSAASWRARTTVPAAWVSPGLMPWPSLSVANRSSEIGKRATSIVSPGLMPWPSLSATNHERHPGSTFVDVSPGLMPWPSLSAHRLLPACTGSPSRVAGADALAFVERGARNDSTEGHCRARRPVSPGLMPWPSLSGSSLPPGLQQRKMGRGVAGADALAFVERPIGRPIARRSASGVAGADALAFVERVSRATLSVRADCSECRRG